MKSIYLQQGFQNTIDILQQIVDKCQEKNGTDFLPVKVSIFQSILLHHLLTEKKLSSNPKPSYIRYRQIIQHNQIKKVESSSKHIFLLSLLKRVWMIELFKNCLVSFEKKYFEEKIKIKDLKPKVADQYLFQLYKLREFIETGLASQNQKQIFQQYPLSNILLLSDEALYEIIQQKASVYKQTKQEQVNSRIQDLKKQRYDLLKMFPAKCLTYSQHYIKDYIYQDLKFILNEAILIYDHFEKDMKHIFGKQILCDLKVKKIANQFNVIGIRRLLSKWAQNLLLTDPQLVQTKAFHEFIKNKKIVFDNFYMKKSELIPTCHQKIISLLLDFLISAVYKQKLRNQNFGFFIYDILRSKIAVQTVEEIQTLIQNLKNQVNTLKKISIFRIKNRLSTHNRDVMVNFIYGDFLPAEIQIGLSLKGTQKQKKQKKEKYQYKHFLYELSRSIFGPTIQLINIYEDNYKEKQQAKMYSVGLVKRRDKNLHEGIQFTQFLCPSNHKLLYIQSVQFLHQNQLCRNCFNQLIKDVPFLYCYQCTIVYCQTCYYNFKTNKIQNIQKSLNVILEIKCIETLKQLQGFNLMIYSLDYSPACKLMQKYLKYFGNKLKNQLINMHLVNINKQSQFMQEVNSLQLTRFPSFVLYKDGKCIKKLIGASIYQIFDLINVVENRGLSKLCPNEHELIYLKPSKFLNWKCNQCLAQREQNKDEQILYCGTCYYFTCNKCAFSKNQQQVYEDELGLSYLSTPLIKQNRYVCSKKHKLALIHQIVEDNIEYVCMACKTSFLFIQESGIYNCSLCKQYLCNKCSSYGYVNIINNREIANHFVQYYNLDLPLCICGFPFKNTYRNTKKIKFCYCFYCRKTIQTKKIKISCFRCGIDICIDCISKIKFQDNDEPQYDLDCNCNGKIIKFQNKQDLNILSFLCTICYQRFYINTMHYQCQNCKFKICKQCIKSKRVKLKICCMAYQNQASKIKQFELDVYGNQTLQRIEGIMKKWKLVDQDSKGYFKLKNDWQSQALPIQTNICQIDKSLPLYYFEYFEILNKVVQQIIILPFQNIKTEISIYNDENQKNNSQKSDNISIVLEKYPNPYLTIFGLNNEINPKNHTKFDLKLSPEISNIQQTIFDINHGIIPKNNRKNDIKLSQEISNIQQTVFDINHAIIPKEKIKNDIKFSQEISNIQQTERQINPRLLQNRIQSQIRKKSMFGCCECQLF